MQADLATLCDLEDSIVVATTFLRTYLTCIDCCLEMNRSLFRTEGRAIQTLPYTPRCTVKSQKGRRGVLYLFWLTGGHGKEEEVEARDTFRKKLPDYLPVCQLKLSLIDAQKTATAPIRG
jgi:hypothetical protein